MADSDLSTQMTEVLTIYSENINAQLREVTRDSMRKLVKETKATAPIGRRTAKERYKRHITADYKSLKGSPRGLKGQDISATWYVRAPEYRLTHLLVHGHATKNGGRSKANPFLHNAREKVVQEYEQKVQEVLSNGN